MVLIFAGGKGRLWCLRGGFEMPPVEKYLFMLSGLDATRCFLWENFGLITCYGITIV